MSQAKPIKTQLSVQDLNESLKMIKYIKTRFDYIAAENIFGRQNGIVIWRKFNGASRTDPYKFICGLSNEEKLTLVEWYNKNN
jgi:hypothetical protein